MAVGALIHARSETPRDGIRLRRTKTSQHSKWAPVTAVNREVASKLPAQRARRHSVAHDARRRGCAAPDVPGRPPPRGRHQPAGRQRHRALHGVHRRRALLPARLRRLEGARRARHAPVPLPAGQRILQVEAVPGRAGPRPGPRAAARHAHRRSQEGADRLRRALVLLRARLLGLPAGRRVDTRYAVPQPCRAGMRP